MKSYSSILITIIAFNLPGLAGAQPAAGPQGLEDSPWAAQPMQRMTGMGGMPRGPMMNPRMREMMMQRRQQMTDDELNPEMHRRHHKMVQRMMERRMGMMQGQGGPGGGKMGMRHRMMQEMRGKKMEHMKNMEQRLARIEALLEELVEKSKAVDD